MQTQELAGFVSRFDGLDSLFIIHLSSGKNRHDNAHLVSFQPSF